MVKKNRPAEEYEVTACPPRELIRAEIDVNCGASFNNGKATLKTMRRDLPNSGLVAVARTGDLIVGIGAIKRARKQYGAKVAKHSGMAFRRIRWNSGMSRRIPTTEGAVYHNVLLRPWHPA